MTPIQAPALPEVSGPQLDVPRGYTAGHTTRGRRALAFRSGLLTDNDVPPGRGQSR